MHDLAGRTALVTGAAGGLGAAIAARLAAMGAFVYAADLVARASSAGAVDAAGTVPVQCDVAQPGSVRDCFARVQRDGRSVDILVANAGIYPAEPFESIALESWRRVFAVNVEGTFLCCQAALPRMRERGWGRIVAIGSNTFHLGWPMLAHYVASKGALTGLMRTLAVEYGTYGITANVVSPTLTRTPGTSALFDGAPDVVSDLIARQAIRRAGEPEDVAGVVAMLCREEAAFVTGQTISADGGLAKL